MNSYSLVDENIICVQNLWNQVGPAQNLLLLLVDLHLLIRVQIKLVYVIERVVDVVLDVLEIKIHQLSLLHVVPSLFRVLLLELLLELLRVPGGILLLLNLRPGDSLLKWVLALDRVRILRWKLLVLLAWISWRIVKRLDLLLRLVLLRVSILRDYHWLFLSSLVIKIDELEVTGVQ